MALITIILRKMIKNKWLELSLLIGLIISIAMVTSIPLYTTAILNRMLVQELDQLYVDSRQYPGNIWASAYLQAELTPEERGAAIQRFDQYVVDKALSELGLPIVETAMERATRSYSLKSLQRDKGSLHKTANIAAISGLEEHIRLIDGRMPAAEPVDGVYEALVVSSALSKLDMVLGNEFAITDTALDRTIAIRPVGVFDKHDQQDLYWYADHLSGWDSTFFVPFELFEAELTAGHSLPVQSASWHAVFDYKQMTLKHVDKVRAVYFKLQRKMHEEYKQHYTVQVHANDSLQGYKQQEQKLRLLLWCLNAPIMIMLGIYLMMITNLIIEHNRNEIAVLQSRGASRKQIVGMYMLSGLLTSVVALLSGPLLGMLLTKILGASNGFLEFVHRNALRVQLDQSVWLHAVGVVLVFLLLLLIPTFRAARTSIVHHKRHMARKNRATWAHRMYLDVILLSGSLYAMYRFKEQLNVIKQSELGLSGMDLDPLLFLTPALFGLGTILFILRVYPLVIRFVSWLGRSWWSPGMYAALMQVGRSGKSYQFLMVFMMLTTTIGLFSASAARTLNQNAEEQIKYKHGADVVLSFQWTNQAAVSFDAFRGISSDSITSEKMKYEEPPYAPILQLPMVESAAKFFKKDQVEFTVHGNRGTATLFGIETDEFGRTVWFPDDLLPYHLNEYLNLIAEDPTAVLISSSLASSYGVVSGDQISLRWSGTNEVVFTVYEAMEYFPTQSSVDKDKQTASKPFIVGHLVTIQNRLALEPYDVWLKLEPGAIKDDIAEAMEQFGLRATAFTDTTEEIRQLKNAPDQLAMNGATTLGFLISALICLSGFLIYWILNFFARTVQLGMYRAMGLSFKELIGMLSVEQLLTSGAAVGIGSFVGFMTSYLFIPMFQLSYDSQLVPPFFVVYNASDYWKLYGIMGAMIVVGLTALALLLGRLKIAQAIKLGE